MNEKTIKALIGESILNKTINNNSQEIEPGDIFLAETDEYINDAIKNGAEIIITSKPLKQNITTFITPSPQKLFVDTFKEIYKEAFQELKFIGVTGTNGKTTTTIMINKILNYLNEPTGYIGTNGYAAFNEKSIYTGLTTPDYFKLYEIIEEFIKKGVKNIVMEVSSHAVSQERIYGLNFAIGIFTNFSEEHLDYHKTIEEYFNAKKKFIEKTQIAILNTEDQKINQIVHDQVIFPELKMQNVDNFQLKIQEVNLKTNDKKEVEAHLNMHPTLFGEFNYQNLIFAIAAVQKLKNISITEIIKAVNQIDLSVEGRMQKVINEHNKNIIIDFAHDPEAIKNVLNQFTDLLGNIIVVIGAPGKRYKGKRIQMGETLNAYADLIVLTEDDPRDEDPRLIAEEIAMGINNFEKVHIIPDREEAIEAALQMATHEDIVLLLGKGAECKMHRQDGEYQYSEYETVHKILERFEN